MSWIDKLKFWKKQPSRNFVAISGTMSVNEQRNTSGRQYDSYGRNDLYYYDDYPIIVTQPEVVHVHNTYNTVVEQSESSKPYESFTPDITPSYHSESSGYTPDCSTPSYDSPSCDTGSVGGGGDY